MEGDEATSGMGGMSMASAAAGVVPEIILLAGAVIVLITVLFTPRRVQRLAPWLSLAVLSAAGAASLAQLTEPQAIVFFDTWARDGTAVLGKLIVLASAAISAALCLQWFRTDPRAGELQTMLLFATLGAVVLTGAADLMELVLGLLLSSVAGYVLAAYHRQSKESGEAALKYYLLGALTNALLLYGVVLLFGLVGSTTYPALAEALPSVDPLGLLAGFGLVLLGVAFKIGAVPVHPWVPDVAEGAPAPAAAFLLTVPKVGGVIAVARLAAVLADSPVAWRPTLALVAAATMTLGNLAALWQDDVRRLLGWSAVSQTGYALMAPVALTRSDLAIPSLLLFLTVYAAANLAAFGVVVELRGRTAMADYAGLGRVRPWLLAALTVAFLSMVGIPPLGGFAGKLALFAATIDAGYAWLAALAVVNSVVSLFYYARVIGPAYFAPAPAAVPVLGSATAVATGVAAVLTVFTGLAAEPLVAAFTDALLLP
ncbi:MAG: NADH-quinone oxidoreductase subunit N [Egibacteraceae bacterium]